MDLNYPIWSNLVLYAHGFKRCTDTSRVRLNHWDADSHLGQKYCFKLDPGLDRRHRRPNYLRHSSDALNRYPRGGLHARPSCRDRRTHTSPPPQIIRFADLQGLNMNHKISVEETSTTKYRVTVTLSDIENLSMFLCLSSCRKMSWYPVWSYE